MSQYPGGSEIKIFVYFSIVNKLPIISLMDGNLCYQINNILLSAKQGLPMKNRYALIFSARKLTSNASNRHKLFYNSLLSQEVQKIVENNNDEKCS